MATFKMPYSYRQFSNCKLATFVDKYTHHPIATMFLGMFWGCLVMLIGVFFYNLDKNPDKDGVFAIISYVFLLVGIILLFIGGWLIQLMSDEFDWAGAIALKHAIRQRRNQTK